MKHRLGTLLALAAGCLLAVGCTDIDVVREGVTGGVSRGFERAIGGVIQDIIEAFLGVN